MIAIALTFPAGRYHATPWGRHVNEGAVEWPPSPWRLLRSLVAVWKRTLSDEPQERVEPILRALAAPPRFALPPASTGHTRHYMPWDKKGPGDRTKIFDAFVALAPDSELVACWPDADLEPSQRELLRRLLANLNFLGRAESWCEARLLDDAAARDFGSSVNCAALVDGESAAANDELVRTLCPGDAAFANDSFFTNKVKNRSKTSVTERVRTVDYDPDWHIAAETLWLHEQKWSDPPGSQWVTYARPRNCFEILHRAQSRRRPSTINIARFAIDSSVLPLVTDTLPLAEAARRALMSLHGKAASRNGEMGKSPILAGKNATGTPAQGHQHAYYLPSDEDGDGRLDHLTVYAAAGFDVDEQRAIERLSRISRSRDNPHPLRLLLLAALSASALRQSGTRDRYAASFGPSRFWLSTTPYLVNRHPKTRGAKRLDLSERAAVERFLLADVREALASARPDLAADVAIELLTDENGRFVLPGGTDCSRTLRPLQFCRFRSKAGDDGGRRLSAVFRLTFPSPVFGPIALGHSSHFGMGLFRPAPS